MSKQGRFSADELDALSVWHTPDFFNADGSVNAHQEERSKAAPRLTVEEIEAMQQQAFDEAFAQGKQEGYTKGFQEGQLKGFKQGQIEGHKEGLEQGMAEAKVQQEAMITEFNHLMESLSEPFKKLDEMVEKQLVSLAIAIASQLVRREIKQHPGEIMAVVRAAVNVLPVAVQKLSLYLHPHDAELVRNSLALSDTMTSWIIVEDPLLTQGGCKVATDVSFVDATIEKRLASVIAMVLGDERDQEGERT